MFTTSSTYQTFQVTEQDPLHLILRALRARKVPTLQGNE